MDANQILSQMTIPAPCDMNWDRMRGDDRVRHCSSCGKHVFDFTSMSSDEATTLIRAQGAEICGRFFERPDGTLVISECQSGPPPPARAWQFHIRTFMAVIAGFAATLGIARSIARIDLSKPAKKPTAGAATLIMGSMAPRRNIQATPTGNQPSCTALE